MTKEFFYGIVVYYNLVPIHLVSAYLRTISIVLRQAFNQEEKKMRTDAKLDRLLLQACASNGTGVTHISPTTGAVTEVMPTGADLSQEELERALGCIEPRERNWFQRFLRIG